MPSVLVILSGADTWTMKNGTRHPTGFWAEEFVSAHRTFREAGLTVDIATPGGRRPTVDPLSLSLGYNDNDQANVDAQKAYLEGLENAFDHALALADVVSGDYDALFIVGGHGPMQDLAVDPDIGFVIRAMLDTPGKVVSSVCHGAAAFLSAFNADGSWLLSGRKLTGFSNEEETAATFAGNAPWLLEDRLRLAGAEYLALPAWTPHVVADGNLITGQQQVSAEKTAQAVVARLGA